MTQTLTPPASLALNLRALELSETQFERVAADNPELRLELTAEGDLIVMPPTGVETGRRNSRITQRLLNWADGAGGVVFDSSTGFTLPNGAKRSPDAAWIRSERYDALTKTQKDGLRAVGPGSTSSSCPPATASCTSSAPGSDRPGVPASVTKAMCA